MHGLNTPTTLPTGAPPKPDFDADTFPVLARWIGSWQFSVRRRALSVGELTHRYDCAAPGWCRMLDRLGFPNAYETLLRRALGEAASEVNNVHLRVLDCGVGTGALSCALARVLPAPFKLDAIDLSPRMLELARGNLHDFGLEVSLRRGDVRNLPYGDGVFDLVMTSHMLEHLVDPNAALDEMVRVLKPGGLLVTCLTRRSPLGLVLHLRWRTHRVTPSQAVAWLHGRGLEGARCFSFNESPFCRQLSLACVARKPANEFVVELAA